MPDPPRDESPSGAAPQTQEHTPTGFHRVVTDLSRAAWLCLDNLFGDGFSVFVPDVQCWTPEAGRGLRAAVAGNREEGAGTFLEKLQDRLTGSDSADPPCSGADPASRPAELQSQTVDEACSDHRSPLLAPQPSGNDPVGVDRDLDAIHRKLHPQTPDRHIDWYTEPWHSQWKPSPHVDSRAVLVHLRAVHARPPTLEARHDEYETHIPENRILRTAPHRMAQMQGVPANVRSRLRRLAARLAGARLLVAGQPRPSWRASRLNQRYVPALHVAELVLEHLGLSIEQGSQPVASFVINMADTFERFVTTAVLDAKYKLMGAATEHGPRPPDLYQMLAHCTVLGLDRGTLVYAAENEKAQPVCLDVAACHARITAWPLDVSAPPGDL